MSPSRQSRRLTQVDAFFVAYQEAAGIAMQLNAEVEIAGEVGRGEVEAALGALVERWPHLGQTIRRRLFGLVWAGPVRRAEMLSEAAGDPAPAVERWRNTRIDPFREPPFQALWVAGRGGGTLALRAHHAALDGEGFHAACTRLLRHLAGGGPESSSGRSGERPLPGFWRLLWRGDLGPMWRHLRWLRKESKAGSSARLAVRSTEPGDVAVCRRWFAGGEWERLAERARALHIHPAWLCCAAWVRAIGAWNTGRGESEPRVSLEVPVSVRRGRESAGNAISPLVLFADATAPLEDTAVDLKRQVTRGLRRRAHLAMPLLTTPGRYLPWSIFRRVAADTTYSGFATSHFTWLDEGGDLRREIGRRSGGRLALGRYGFSTPVCLHMGAALMAVPGPSGLLLSITHRLAALPPADAAVLADLVAAELV